MRGKTGARLAGHFQHAMYTNIGQALRYQKTIRPNTGCKCHENPVFSRSHCKLASTMLHKKGRLLSMSLATTTLSWLLCGRPGRARAR